jgi:transposase-like protein
MSQVSAASVKVDQEYCPGSYKKAEKKGSKYIGNRLKYLCPDCHKHYTRDASGRITKHGYKVVANRKGEKTWVSHCASCRKKFEGLDYLCPKCRLKSER